MTTPPALEPLGGLPPVGNGFLLEVTGVQIGLFMEVSGLELTVGVEEHQEGGQNGFVHKLPGRVTWPNIVLKRGLTESTDLFDWIAQSGAPAGEFDTDRSSLERTTAAITVVDHQGNRLRAWELTGVFPVKWTGPQLSAGDGSPMTESLELAHHGFRMKKPTKGHG